MQKQEKYRRKCEKIIVLFFLLYKLHLNVKEHFRGKKVHLNIEKYDLPFLS